MIILNTEKLVKIIYHEKLKNSKMFFDKDNNVCMFGFLGGNNIIVGYKMAESQNSYLEDGVFYYSPCLEFYSDDKSIETKYFETTELAKKFIEKIKQEPNLKTFTIE